MSRLRLALTAIVLAVFAGVVGTQILLNPSVVGADIGGGRVGPRGPTGPAGATGPNWTTCAELASSITNEQGTCGAGGGPVLSTSPTITTPTLSGNTTAGTINSTTIPSSKTLTVTTDNLSVFASTTSAQFATLCSDETGTAGSLVFSVAPTFTAGTNQTAVTATGNGTGHGTQGTSANNGSSHGIYGIGTTNGNGVKAENTSGSGYALVIVGNSGTPTKAPVYFQPESGTPSAAGTVGDVYVHTGGVIRTEVLTTPVYVSQSNLGIKSTAAAAGTNQSTATALSTNIDFYTITGCDGTKGITLTQAGTGTCIRIMAQDSTVTNTCKVYGHNSDNDTINGGAADAAYTQVAGTSLTYCNSNGTDWFTY